MQWMVLFLFVFSGCGHISSVYVQHHIVSHPYRVESLSQATVSMYVDAVNRMRSQGRVCGSLGYFPPAPPLHWNNALYHAAYEHSADMAQNNMFSHDGSGTMSDWTMYVQHLNHASNFTDRIENNGYQEWRRLAQNIAAGMPDVMQTMKQWEDSERHCANIMDREFTDFGMAHVYRKGTDFRDYWTQNFAVHQ